jgi:hypothetical protein
MPKGLFHPFSKALYEQHGDGLIRVTDGDKQGIFGSDGHWIEGELRECDPQLCNWVSGPLVANHRVGDTAGQDTHRQEH